MRAHRQPLVEFTDHAFDLHELNRAFVVHVGDLVVIVHAEVGTGDDLADVHEVKALQADWRHFFLVVLEVELIEALSLVVDLDPSIVRQGSKDLVFCLQPELVPELAAGAGTENIVLPLFSRCRFERALDIVK